MYYSSPNGLSPFPKAKAKEKGKAQSHSEAVELCLPNSHNLSSVRLLRLHTLRLACILDKLGRTRCGPFRSKRWAFSVAQLSDVALSGSDGCVRHVGPSLPSFVPLHLFVGQRAEAQTLLGYRTSWEGRHPLLVRLRGFGPFWPKP